MRELGNFANDRLFTSDPSKGSPLSESYPPPVMSAQLSDDPTSYRESSVDPSTTEEKEPGEERQYNYICDDVTTVVDNFPQPASGVVADVATPASEDIDIVDSVFDDDDVASFPVEVDNMAPLASKVVEDEVRPVEDVNTSVAVLDSETITNGATLISTEVTEDDAAAVANDMVTLLPTSEIYSRSVQNSMTNESEYSPATGTQNSSDSFGAECSSMKTRVIVTTARSTTVWTPGQTFVSGDREFDFLKTDPVRRRTSSLKTSKTYAMEREGSEQGLKKAVRFADALGLDLASIRHIINVDEPPVVPRSAIKDLKLDDDDTGISFSSDSVHSYFSSTSSSSSSTLSMQRTRLCLRFSQPGCTHDFTGRVLERRVSLESCAIDDNSRTLSGVVCVANIVYAKKVVVRSTLDGWLTYADEDANWLRGSADGRTDRFMFVVRLPPSFGAGGRMEFSVMYVAGEETFWDSNFGANYAVECVAEMSPSLRADEGFGRVKFILDSEDDHFW